MITSESAEHYIRVGRALHPRPNTRERINSMTFESETVVDVQCGKTCDS